ncbi:MAG: hypothetical protein AUH85_16825 [Chloroflexi bacterium 13_1_40CM_4_68_4]|nr:MAG: hypothetical protein AUH85_16825 [Chloroflexi bacterium 13_1_40CM_4_68_4]
MGGRGQRRDRRARDDPAHARGGGAHLRRPYAVAAATGALIIIGTLEAGESARQLADVGRGPLAPSGAGITAVGLAASCAVYVALGWWLRDDRAAIRAGLLTGLISGAAGGAIRALLIAGALREIVSRYAAVPDWFIAVVLGVFVVLATGVSAAGGAALAFAGVRVAKAARPRPPA